MSMEEKENSLTPELKADAGILKRHAIDDMSLEEVIKFAKKSGVEYLTDVDIKDRVNVVLPVLSHLAQEEDLLLGFGILDITASNTLSIPNPSLALIDKISALLQPINSITCFETDSIRFKS